MANYKRSMTESLMQVYLGEDNMTLMKKAAGGANQTIKMKDGKLKMDSFTASAIMAVYNAVNPKNKKSIEKMINSGSKSQIMKLQSLAMKQIKSSYEEVDESTKEYAKTLDKIAKDKALKMLTKSERENLKKIAALFAKEELDKDDEKVVKKIVGKLKKASQAHAGQSKELQKAIDEDGHTDVASAVRKCMTITEDAQDINSKLQTMSTEDSLPSWWTNKLAVASNDMNKMRDYIVNPVQEEVELDEAQDGGDFKPHMMYDPKTGKGYKADTMDDHLRMKKMGYTHDAPKKEEVKEYYEIGTDEYRDHTLDVTPGQDDPEWVAARDFKVTSMKEALAKVWGLDEKALDKESKKDYDEEDEKLKPVKGSKTMTGGKVAKVEIQPKIDG